jgi:tetratricopeptide (TPR) repeat protein
MGQHGTAVGWAEAALIEVPGDPESCLVLGSALLARDNEERMREVVQLAQTTGLSNSELARFQAGKGVLYLRSGRPHLGLQAADLARHTDPRSTDALLLAAASHTGLGDLANAAAKIKNLALRNHLAIAQSDPRQIMWVPELALSSLGQDLARGMRRDVVLDSDSRNVAGVLAWLRGMASARGLLESALREDPGSTSAHAALAQLHFDAERWAKSSVHAQQALRSAPTNGLFHAMLGAIAIEEERWEAAETHFQRALQHAPRDAAVLLLRARAHAAAGDVDAAKASARQALAVAPGLAEADRLIRVLDPAAPGQ